MRVLICGTGAAGHVLAGIASTHPDIDVCVFTTNTTKVGAWNRRKDTTRLTVFDPQRAVASAGPFVVTDDPERAARGRDVVVFVLPAFLHRRYLTALAPHLEDGCLIVGLPGQPGFEFEVAHILDAARRTCPMINFDSLPWICRLTEFATAVTIKGTKHRLTGAVQGDLAAARVPDPGAALQRLLGQPPRLELSGHPLGITLRSPNASNHPPMMYSRWKDWRGGALDRPPLFYESVDEPMAALLQHVNDEVIATARRIMVARPDADLSQVIPQYDWEISSYGHVITDPTNLMTALRTNLGYAGITHPMTQPTPGRYVPDFGHRFLSEDVPYGLVVLRGIAEIASVPTPWMDAVITWAQERLGTHYLVGGRLSGTDLAATRCPQRYGLHSIDQLLDPAPVPA